MSKINMEITEADLKQVAADLEGARENLNKLSHSFNQVNGDLLELSERTDVLIVKYMRMAERYKQQKKNSKRLMGSSLEEASVSALAEA
jgi:hypothetical protein